MPVIFKFSNTSNYVLCIIGKRALGPEQYIQKMGISKALYEGISLNYKNFSKEEKIKADIILKSHKQNGCVTCIVNNENVKIFNNGELSNPSVRITIIIDDAVISYSFQNYLKGTNLFKTHFNILESENIPLIAGGLYHDIRKELPNCKFISSLSDALDYGRRVKFKNRLEQLNCEFQNTMNYLQDLGSQIKSLYDEFDKIADID